MPSVTRNDGIPSFVTRRPLTTPIAAPMPRTRIGASQPGAPRSSSSATIIPDQLATEPTERSISAQMITNVMPTAMIVTRAVMRRIASAVLKVAKFGAKTMKNSVTAAKIT